MMQPRSKKGPSWANEDAVPGPSTSQPSLKENSAPEDEEMDEDPQPQESSAVEPASDMDWLRRHTKSALTLDSEEKAFEQSDSEPDEPNEPVSFAVSFPSFIYLTFNLVRWNPLPLLRVTRIKPLSWRLLVYSSATLLSRVPVKKYHRCSPLMALSHR